MSDTTIKPRYRVHVLARDWVWHKDTKDEVGRLLQHLGDYYGQTNIIDLSTMDCLQWNDFEATAIPAVDAGHPQNQVPAGIFNYLATVIRRLQLDGPDLALVASAVDDGKDAGVGEDLVKALGVVLNVYPLVSAQFLIDQAVDCLGWPVTA